jgi:hypothetical protein
MTRLGLLLEREVKELRRANEILRKASAFCHGGARPPREMMMAFIDAHREDLGIEPICRELAIAPSSYHEHARRLADPGRRPARARAMTRSRRRSSASTKPVRRLWSAQGLAPVAARGVAVARCTVERLMRLMGLAGVRRGKTTITTVSNPKRRARSIRSTASFAFPGPTHCGWSILPTVRLERICLECLGEGGYERMPCPLLRGHEPKRR